MLKVLRLLFLPVFFLGSVAQGMEPTAQTPDMAFKDVPENHVYKMAIEYVKNEGIVKGYPDGNFQPQWPINRAEFTKILVESHFGDADIQGCEKSQMNFSDVAKSAWYAPYVCMAQKAGIVKGYEDGTFQPTWNIRITEAAKVIVKSFQLPTNNTSDIWYEPFLLALSQRSAIPATIERLDHNVTRGEMAEFIYRLNKGVRDRASTAFFTLTGHMPNELPEVKEEVPEALRRTYSDGSFTVESEYMSPGGKNKMAVTLVLAGDNVQSMSISAIQADNTSRNYIRLFKTGAENDIVGLDLDEIDLPTRVNGSSLTGIGFARALEAIKDQAKNNG